MKSAPGQVIAGCFSLCAFCIAVLMGVAAGNEALTILGRAILAMIVCYVIGSIVGAICEHCLRGHVAALQRAAEEKEAAEGKASPEPADNPAAEEVVVV